MITLGEDHKLHVSSDHIIDPIKGLLCPCLRTGEGGGLAITIASQWHGPLMPLLTGSMSGGCDEN